jgi:hypothetical protein
MRPGGLRSRVSIIFISSSGIIPAEKCSRETPWANSESLALRACFGE